MLHDCLIFFQQQLHLIHTFCPRLCMAGEMVLAHIIGASVSEPHTSVTALRTCICMLACLLVCLWPCTINFKWAYLNISQRLNVKQSRAQAAVVVKGYCHARVERRYERNPE